MPFIERCLSSLPAEGTIPGLELILVDSASTDRTSQTMIALSNRRSDARLFRIDGTANASAARNVALEYASTLHVMLLDGDTELSLDFLREGIRQIDLGRADAVLGSMLELRHSLDDTPEPHPVWRRRVTQERYVIVNDRCTGSILLGPKAIESNLRYDETLRRGEDRDYTLRLSSVCRVLQIPRSMGLHLTRHYYSKGRLIEFYREMYPRPMGHLLRKHRKSLRSVLTIAWLERGPVLGMAYQTLFLAGLVTGHVSLLAGVASVAFLDYMRFTLQGRQREFIPVRGASPWMIILGLVGPGEPHPQYTVRERESESRLGNAPGESSRIGESNTTA